MLNRFLPRSLSVPLSWSFLLFFGSWLAIADAHAEAASGDSPQKSGSLGDAKTEPADKAREVADRSDKSKTSAGAKEKTSKAANVRYLPQKDGVWSMAETDNFRIFFKGDIKPIDKMAQVVE